MKLKDVQLSLTDKLKEFEHWITSSIQQISDTFVYKKEMRKVTRIIESLGNATNQFEKPENCNAERMALYCVKETERIINEEPNTALASATEMLDALIAMLFLVTGRSDNNLKCQFPVFLLQHEQRTTFPTAKKRGSVVSFEHGELGRVIKQEKICKLIADALVLRERYNGDIDLEAEATWLLKSYIEAILNSQDSVEQLWALGRSYFSIKQTNPGYQERLLAPIVVFKVRGAVAAQSGHIPERILRTYMKSWGLRPGIDYNLSDVVISAQELGKDEIVAAAETLNEDKETEVIDDLSADPTKTRAYDFALPFQAEGWEAKLFIQAQFYAGDSGSVSHKVVDQTRSSRILTRAKYPEARFLEYLDGAGYYSSLHRDLQHMLEMPSTTELIQIRTAHIKLRRALQQIGFLTPLDFTHAVLRSPAGDFETAKAILDQEGYGELEIQRCFTANLGVNFLEHNGAIHVRPRLLITSRRLFLLDLLFQESEEIIPTNERRLMVLTPGAGPCHGTPLSRIGRVYEACLKAIPAKTSKFGRDLEWLSEHGFIRLEQL